MNLKYISLFLLASTLTSNAGFSQTATNSKISKSNHLIDSQHFNLKSYPENQENLKLFIQNLINFAMNTLNGPESDDTKKSRIKAILDHSFDISGISDFVLGKFNKSLTASQKSEFQVLFKEYLLGFYANVVKLYNGQAASITKISKDNDQNLYLVLVDIINNNNANLSVQYVIRYKNSKFVILDAISQNLSFVNTLKSQFSSILGETNGFENLKSFLKVSDPKKLRSK